MTDLGYADNAPQRCCEGCFTARSVQHQPAATDDSKILAGLHTLYRQGIKPLERQFQFDAFYSPLLSAADFDPKPLVLLLGQYSVGKTSFIKHLIGRDYPNGRIGPEPTTERFTLVSLSGSDKDQVIPGNALAVQTNRPFKALEKFGSAFLSKFEAAEVAVAPDADAKKLPGAILHRMSFLDTPGVLSGEKQRLGRAYNFSGVVEFFGGRADRILLLFDAHKLDISDEFKACIEALKGHDDKIRIVLNKSDAIDAQQLMKVHGALMWSLGKVIRTPECLRVYVGSWWDEPVKHDEFAKLFKREQEDLLADLFELPQSAVMRKVNEVVKRARAARVHALVIEHLRSQLPWMGKDSALQSMLGNLAPEFRAVAQAHAIPLGDFPVPEHFRRSFESIVGGVDGLMAFPALNPLLLAELNEIISARLPHLVASHHRNNARELENPFADARQWAVPPEFFQAARAEFDTLGPDANGLLTGSQARPVLLQSGLSTKVLAKVWQLADRDKDGKLTAKEFALAKWLIKVFPDGVLPDVLPRDLEPM